MHTSPPEIFDRISQMEAQGDSYVLATVISMRGSTAAKTGAKAIFDDMGKNQFGWVGGGCAESFLARESVAALRERTPRIVTVDLDDEVFGLMPCGGTMDVYLEPYFPPKQVKTPNFGKWQEPISQFLRQIGYMDSVQEERIVQVSDWPSAFMEMLEIVSHSTDRPLRSISGQTPPGGLSSNGELIILGQSRITEELSRMAKLLERRTVCELPGQFAERALTKDTCVIIGSHHPRDNEFIAQALLAGVSHVALIASPKRAKLIREDLVGKGFDEPTLRRFFSPAGLALPSDTPSQIAFSIIGEILLYLEPVHGT